MNAYDRWLEAPYQAQQSFEEAFEAQQEIEIDCFNSRMSKEISENNPKTASLVTDVTEEFYGQLSTAKMLPVFAAIFAKNDALAGALLLELLNKSIDQFIDDATDHALKG